MIRVSAHYPNSEDARFDHAYYHAAHRPILQIGEVEVARASAAAPEAPAS